MREERLEYLDNIRLLVIVLVVLMHAAVTYSGMGGWYFKEGGTVSIPEKLLFALGQSFTQSFFMGLLFLVAGYMVPRPLARKGTRGFLTDRLVRLGGPALSYMLVVNPFINYVLIGQAKLPFLSYLSSYYLTFKFLGGSGPLWFAIALLIFSAVYAVGGSRADNVSDPAGRRVFGAGDVAKIILLITIGAFLIRLVQPIDTSILNMQLCYFSSYIILFGVGIRAAEGQLLERIEPGFALRCLLIALVPCVILWGWMVYISGALAGHSTASFKGGLNWQSLLYAFWESATAVLMSVGLLGLFHARFNRQSSFFSKLSDSAFAVYAFHAPILVAVSLALRGWQAAAWLKFLAAGSLALAVSFGLSHLFLKKLPLFQTRIPAKRVNT